MLQHMLEQTIAQVAVPFFSSCFCLLAHKIGNIPHCFMPQCIVQGAKQKGAVRKIDREMLCLYKQNADGGDENWRSPYV